MFHLYFYIDYNLKCYYMGLSKTYYKKEFYFLIASFVKKKNVSTRK